MTRSLLFNHPKIKKLNIDKNSIFAYIVIISITLKWIWIESTFIEKIDELFLDEDYITIDKEKMWFSDNWKEVISEILS